ncbi:MAG TPA: glutamine-hydrolyzing carbamoyl-phosphate synthase small subunit [Deltaproteobacteria bacterium]|nr:glutamine-hydrolyzing carbamoyl-phosphate synthase small subunit [Deltaproteobacteria bacterium]
MKDRAQRPAVLVLEDGSSFDGFSFAGHGETLGEVVFNTSMTGYQEALTDPSYKGQILMMTYPLIGNYGINEKDMESASIHMEGFIVREYCRHPSNHRARMTLQQFLEEQGKIGIEGVDTRALTRIIRTRGAMRGIISTQETDKGVLREKVRSYPGLVGQDMVQHVSCTRSFLWIRGIRQPLQGLSEKKDRIRVVVLDCGVKLNILRELEKRGCEIVVVPAGTGPGDIISFNPDGILLSNGPGDPEPISYAVRTVRELLGRYPVFGICLGHQILGQALGAKTEKLRFGHHGVNQPVKNMRTGRIEITSQNHNYVVVAGTLPGDAHITHINLNDNTLEGLYYPSVNAFSVQYHPEASPGPHDAGYLFDDFMTMMAGTAKNSAQNRGAYV